MSVGVKFLVCFHFHFPYICSVISSAETRAPKGGNLGFVSTVSAARAYQRGLVQCASRSGTSLGHLFERSLYLSRRLRSVASPHCGLTSLSTCYRAAMPCAAVRCSTKIAKRLPWLPTSRRWTHAVAPSIIVRFAVSVRDRAARAVDRGPSASAASAAEADVPQ